MIGSIATIALSNQFTVEASIVAPAGRGRDPRIPESSPGKTVRGSREADSVSFLMETEAPADDPTRRETVGPSAGTFHLGSDRHCPEEAPAHRVTVGPLRIDRTPVTPLDLREWTTDWFCARHIADPPKACCIPRNPRGGEGADS
jgi:formylglycine-generating enzyme required for sulfatase activity